MTRKLTLIAVAAATALSGAAPALARPVDSLYEPTTRVVKYDDLDLSSARGRERLDRRVRHAANMACGFWAARSLSEKQQVDKCRKIALEKAQPQVTAVIRDAAARYASAN